MGEPKGQESGYLTPIRRASEDIRTSTGVRSERPGNLEQISTIEVRMKNVLSN